ncbi:MAG: hypothetical protein E5X26_00030 [Mesorhizobium sp.]|nr:MAG: hypothetical protein E5X26_00030 [Mesorhizobium sp.]
MNELPGIRSFLLTYFPVFMGTIFASIFSLALAVPLFIESYFRHLPLADSTTWSFLAGIALTLVIVHCNFMIARGRPSWVWPLVAVLGGCFLGVLPVIEYRPDRLIYSLSLFFPLLGLLLLNSKRHREMRSKLVEIRQQRESLIKAMKKTQRKPR